jgi:hypothetical protein
LIWQFRWLCGVSSLPAILSAAGIKCPKRPAQDF